MTDMPAPSPLDEAQLSILARARAARRKVRFGGIIALTNVVGLGLFAFLSFAFGLLELSVSPFALAMAVLAWNEARGRRGLIEADARAPRRLAFNQLALLGCVLAYCIHGAYVAWTGPSLLDSVLVGAPELRELGDAAAGAGTSLGELSEWGRVVALIIYGAVAVASALVQGLTALYYSSLRAAVAALGEAPAWARELA